MTTKVAFVATVLNEAEAIRRLLRSLEKQTQKPDEVIIVDGGSTDSTVPKIKEFSRGSDLQIRTLVKKSNRSRGRDLGIGQARGEAIAVSDAGCVLDKNWLKLITKPIFSKEADVVAGFYRMKTDTIFTHCSAPFVGIMSHNINNQTFLPSSRSIAFTKKAWKKVGGYPTHLNFAEDLVFAQNLKNDPTIKMIMEPKAKVEWTPPENLAQFFQKIKNYTRGSLEAGYVRHLRKNALVAIRYTFGISFLFAVIASGSVPLGWLLFFLVVAYFFYPSYKFFRLIQHPIHLFYFGLLQVTADLAVLTALLVPKNRSRS